jgi:hypothetical protein
MLYILDIQVIRICQTFFSGKILFDKLISVVFQGSFPGRIGMNEKELCF